MDSIETIGFSLEVKKIYIAGVTLQKIVHCKSQDMNVNQFHN